MLFAGLSRQLGSNCINVVSNEEKSAGADDKGYRSERGKPEQETVLLGRKVCLIIMAVEGYYKPEMVCILLFGKAVLVFFTGVWCTKTGFFLGMGSDHSSLMFRVMQFEKTFRGRLMRLHTFRQSNCIGISGSSSSMLSSLN